MTLLDTIRAVEAVAASQPAVNMIVRNDVFTLNSRPDARYGVFAWTQGQHSASAASGLITFNLTLFYVDRLTEDGSNRLEIQSVGVQTLDNILRRLDDLGIEPDGEYTFTTFNQRFLDECAGVFCGVRLTVPANGLCAEDFGEPGSDIIIA